MDNNKIKKGMIIKIVAVPESCYHCDEPNEGGYCDHIGRYIDHINITGRYPTCPIKPLPQKSTDKQNNDDYDKGWNDCFNSVFEGEL